MAPFFGVASCDLLTSVFCLRFFPFRWIFKPAAEPFFPPKSLPNEAPCSPTVTTSAGFISPCDVAPMFLFLRGNLEPCEMSECAAAGLTPADGKKKASREKGALVTLK